MMMKPIRILHVLSAMKMAGTETLLMNLYRNIDRNLVQFDFAVSVSEECAYDSEIIHLGGKIYHYPRYIIRNHIYYKKWWDDFFKEHQEYNIVHGHIGSTASIYLRIAKKHGCFTIAHSHSTYSKISIKEVLYRIYSYPTRFIADYFFGCSKQALVDRYGNRVANDKTKSEVLNNAIDVSRFIFDQNIRNKIRDEYNVKNDKIVIGTVGRLSLPKNPYEIINICKELRDRNIDYIFWWFGEGELKNRIEQMIKENNLEPQIKLLGTRTDVYNVLQGMDIFLFPSIWEGLGIACVEAQASGLPTICSETIPKEAKVSNNCIFVPLNDTGKWSDIIQKIISDYKNNRFIRENKYKDVIKSGYDIKSVVDSLEDFYLKIDCGTSED